MEKYKLALLGFLLSACSPGEPSLDDEAGTTTSAGGSSSSTQAESSTSSSTSPTSPTSETSETSETSSTSETETETWGGFLPPSDLGGCMCDPFAQDCPKGEKCVAYASSGESWDANKCVPVLGEGQAGEACSSDGIVEATDSCGANSFCWDLVDVEGQLVGVCAAFCEGAADNPVCDDPNQSCLIANEGSINLCIQSCDPLAQDCSEGSMCAWTGNDFNCVLAGDPTPYAEPCGQLGGECSAGLECIGADVLPECADTACCTPYCSLANPICAWEGTQCVSFFEGEAPPDYEDIGICVVPGSP